MTKTNNTSVSVRELYQLVDAKMGEVSQSVLRLETKFDNLESGRLATVERELSNMQGRLMIVPLLVSVAISVFGFLVNFMLSPK